MGESNRYVASLCWISKYKDTIRNNEWYAIIRLQQLLKMLKKRELIQEYDNKFKEMIEAGYVVKAARNEIQYFLPHRPVIKSERTTTKLRIVKDGTFNSRNQTSINQALYKGIVAADVMKTLIRFRAKKIGFTADIEKAFWQIKVAENDQSYLGLIWIDSQEKFEYFKMTVVPFGLTCSPFILQSTIQKHCETTKLHPEVASELSSKFYVDDYVNSVDSITNAIEQRTKITEILREANFNIRKWTMSGDNTDPNRILGIWWNPQTDMINLCESKFEIPIKFTRRCIQSICAKIFDPLGLISPVKILLRKFNREACQLKLEWDDEVPIEMNKKVHEAVTNMNELIKTMKMRRTIENSESISIYCDASAVAYGAVAYLCNEKEKILLVSKNYLSGKTTIPELEFQAAIVGIRLMETLKPIFPDHQMILFTDSKVTKERFKKNPNKLKPHLGIQILKLKDYEFDICHISGKSNPADIASRGMTCEKLKDCKLWWNGTNDTAKSKTFKIRIEQEENACVRQIIQILEKQRTHYKATKWLGRIAKWAQKSIERFNQKTEKQIAQIWFLRCCQDQSWGNLIANLEHDERTIWQSYAVFKDDNGILRIRTRIGNNPMFTFEEVHPILLNGENQLTKLIINDVHQNGHLSIQRMHSEIRKKYWITKKGQAIKKAVNSCKTCRILKAKQYDAPAGDLPIARISQGVPYATIGMDHFGPIHVKISDYKGKVYVLLIICLKTLNVSLKVVKSLTTEENWNAIRRFMNDFGYPTVVLSDNSKTFISIGKMYNKHVNENQTGKNVSLKWHHITVYSPYRGGLWERAVKTVEETMQAMSFGKSYKFEEFVSQISDVQYIVNSRSGANDFDAPITPLMMLKGDRNCRGRKKTHFLLNDCSSMKR